MIFIQRYWLPGWHDNFGFELQHLPNIHTVTFRTVDYGVPWYIIATCLEMPHITSIRFQCNAMWANIQPFSQAEVAQASNRLTALSYTPYTWRESASALEKSDLAAEYKLEAACLSALVFGMTATAESLTLPFETAPLARMSGSHWPHLQALSLYGRAVDDTPRVTLSSLVGGMPSLRRLSFEVAASTSTGHKGEQSNSSSSSTVLHLRSLIIAYPDPDDAIFSMIGVNLTKLSLRDWPRYYYRLYCPGDAVWDARILSSSSCLKILKRMNLTRLRDLELVYQADNAEEELLHYLISEMPYLAHLEIHRYRQTKNSCVPYVSPREYQRGALYLMSRRGVSQSFSPAYVPFKRFISTSILKRHASCIASNPTAAKAGAKSSRQLASKSCTSCRPVPSWRSSRSCTIGRSTASGSNFILAGMPRDCMWIGTTRVYVGMRCMFVFIFFC